MAAFLLVHGAGHGGWCWDQVADCLRRAGHKVMAPTLEGVGERLGEATTATGLAVHAAEIAEALRSFDDPAILVGHSYGGMVISGAASLAPERVAALVYLDAAIAQAGESLLDVSPALATLAGATFVERGVRFGLDPQQVAGPIYGLVDPEVLAKYLPLLTPHPWRCFEEPLVLADADAFAQLPGTVINCSATLARRPADKRGRWLAADRVVEVDLPHDLMVTHPGQTAALLIGCINHIGQEA